MARLPPQHRLFLLLLGVGLAPWLLLPASGLAPRPLAWAALPMALLLYLLALRVARPIGEVLALARRLREGDLGARAVLQPGTDWSLLARTMNDLADQLDTVTRSLEEQVAARTAALARKADQLRAVGQVGQQVAAVLEPDVLLHFVTRVMRGTFGYDVVAVLLQHGDYLVLAACAARGREEVPLGRAFPLVGPNPSPLARALADQPPDDGPARADAAGADSPPESAAPTPLLPDMAVEAEMAIPIRLADRTLGLMVVQSLSPDPFDEEDHFTVQTIAGQVAVALENARLLEAERQLRGLAVVEERNRMAREIHDTLAQGFMGIIMQLRAMEAAADPETARFHREAALTLAQESLQEARRSVWNLRPRPLEDRRLSEALAAELAALQRQVGLSGQFTARGAVDDLAPHVEAALLRIAQEAMRNAVKYAQATRLDVRLAEAGGEVTLQVADDGVGFDPACPPRPAGGGFGLGMMAERARQVGGSLELDTRPGAGCRVVVRVPLRKGG
ncbi:GAF domain-containing sensor histidine kinase [Symbiobacterium terraclitae]|uniref:GAF domain-containing sensor histidine kinase n=1 Tax=Symbiobacterium terraclitae TaxID=557451 RepID=UPI0035B55922